MKSRISRKCATIGGWVFCVSLLTGCGNGGGGSSPAPVTPAPTPAEITVAGLVSDDAVEGGDLLVFTADQMDASIGLTIPSGEPVVRVTRNTSDGASYQMELPGERAGQAVFVVLDPTNAEDTGFGGTPPQLESVAILGAEGSTQVLNITTHTTLATQLVRAALDPDGDGTPIDAAAIEAEIGTASTNVLQAIDEDNMGDALYPDGDPFNAEDEDQVHDASRVIGLEIRTLAATEDVALEAALAALAADAGDGELDGEVGAGIEVDAEIADLVAAADELRSIGEDEEVLAMAAGPCSSAAVALQQSCSIDVFDDLFEAYATCADVADDSNLEACRATAEVEAEETDEECGEIFEARLELCETFEDAAHAPAFGEEFAANFVDPLAIGGAVQPNPYLPLIPGTRWVYEGTFIDDEGEEVTETITVTVMNKTKLIQGINCIVVNDVGEEDGEVQEDTNDWFAQDVDGNVWYCGEISRDFEIFDGDDPEERELVEIEGSWKAGREGAEAGILLPAAPEVGDVIRQEVKFGEAEDVIEIVSTTATETAPGGSCTDNCLQTRDFTPLEADANEHKFYAPGVGLIVEIDIESGDRVELVEMVVPPVE